VSRGIPSGDVRAVMQRLLRRAAAEENHRGSSSPRIQHVISALQAENPFDEVLGEIDKMVKVIDAEGKADKEKLDWCNTERTENKADKKEKKGEMLALSGSIDKHTKSIKDPSTGLKKQIANTENSLMENAASQKEETEDRARANKAYLTDVKNLAAAEALLTNAIKVLNAYYDQIDKNFLQESEDPAPPDTFEGNYKGQSDQGGGVIKMLDFILDETQKEEKEAQAEEERSQGAFDGSMTSLKKEQAEKEKSLIKLQDTLATTEADLLSAQEDLKTTRAAKNAIKEYLVKIKPGCDFITSNFDLRKKNQATEKAALQKAATTLEASPAYKKAAADATLEGYGDCKDPCVKNAEDVACKACRADVTIPAYCAGHKGTTGC